MTDKQLIKTLRNIKKYCEEQVDCEFCKFFSPDHEGVECRYDCQLVNVLDRLDFIPSNWNIDEVERIINEAD